jgi:cephalosporin-C deacetylase-like acetyl esterase
MVNSYHKYYLEEEPMKKILAAILAVLMLVSLVACDAPAETTGSDNVTEAPATDAPETDATETDAPETDATETDAPETTDQFDTPTEIEQKDEREYLFKYTFDNVNSMYDEVPSGFSLGFDNNMPYELVPGEDGYIRNVKDDGYIRISDKEFALVGKSFIFEAELTFTSFPVERESNKGKGSYPLSVLSWVRISPTSLNYDFAFKLDGDGYIYTVTNQNTGVKLELGQKYVISAYYTADGQVKILINGRQVGTKTFVPREGLTDSWLRLMDGSRAHFGVQIHSACAYYSDMSQFLPDAERSLSEATDNVSSGVYFEGFTDKDALSYAVGEEINLEIYLMSQGEVVSVPYFYYTVEGEDGKTKTEGYADGSKGHFTVTTKMSKPGHALVTAYMCDQNKNKINTSIVFRGGALVEAEKIMPGAEPPKDLQAYWDKVVAEIYKGDINLIRFEEVSTSKYNYDTNKYKAYLFEIAYGDGEMATGYITYPKNKDSLNLRMEFRGYSATRIADPKFNESAVTVEMAPHAFRMDDPNPNYPDSRYGFDLTENQNPDTVYFHGMLTRNALGARFLKAFACGEEYGKIMFNGKQIEPLGVWKKGDYFLATGGSQGGFQAIAIGALDSDVTEINMGLPWFCDIGGQNIGRFPGNLRPAFTNALMYYDCCSLATMIDKDVNVTLSAGLGDRTCPPSSIMAVYNALDCNKSISCYQNTDHSYTPPSKATYRLRNN